MVLISVYMIIAGVPAIGKIGFIDFLFGTKWASTAAEPSYGILPFILTSVYGTAGAILIGVPVGLLTAVFLSKIAPKGLAAPVSAAVELLAGIPSAVPYTHLDVYKRQVWGFVLFGQRPDALSVLGYVVIVGAAVWMYCYNRRRAGGGPDAAAPPAHS